MVKRLVHALKKFKSYLEFNFIDVTARDTQMTDFSQIYTFLCTKVSLNFGKQISAYSQNSLLGIKMVAKTLWQRTQDRTNQSKTNTSTKRL